MTVSHPPVLVTDTRYRASLAAVQSLGRAGYPVAALHTQGDGGAPAAFASKYVKKRVALPCSAKDADYPGLLAQVCDSLGEEYGAAPVVFPVGAATLAQLAEHREALGEHARFLVSPPAVLEAANDKRRVGELARSLGVPAPKEYPCPGGALPDAFPVVVKPRCGEKFGLHAEERYRKAYDPAGFRAAWEAMARYDPQPVVQELLTGEAVGVSLVMDEKSRPVSALCHRRVREYPTQGGPSSCCESVWDGDLVEHAVKLLRGLGFVGLAMVEFKGGKLLEINPRVWGSFPLTYKCGAPLAQDYVRTSLGEELPLIQGPGYRTGVRMQFVLNDGLACLGYLRQGQPGRGLRGLMDLLNPRVKDGMFSFDDLKPFFRYLKNALGKGGD